MSVQSRRSPRSTPARRRRAGVSRTSSGVSPTVQAAGLAVVVAGALLLLGYLALRSLDHSASPPSVSTATPSVTTGAPLARPRVTRLRLPHFAGIHTTLTLRGKTPTAGFVIVKESYGGVRWKMLARVKANDRAYSVRVYLDRRGLLHLRVLYPDGSRAVGSVHVS